MKVEIGEIHVADRIRKQSTKIEELAEDIQRNGLLNPITVMPVGGEHQLLAGLRRLQAAQLLGWTEIDVNVVPPKDAEAALRIEISENEQRENFTYTERMDFAALIKEIEQAKARERMSQGGKGGVSEGVLERAHLGKKTRDVVGQKIGMSGQTYQRAAYVADHASPEVIEQLDSGTKSINAAYFELRAAEKKTAPPAPVPALPPLPPAPAPVAAPPPAPAHPVIKPPVVAPKPAAPAPQQKKAPPPAPMREPVPPPETPLERAIRAERELDAMKYRWDNEIFHRESIIENLKMRNEALVKHIGELETALEAAQARIRELEAGHA